METMALNELIEQVKQKDEHAFQELYQRFYKKAYYAALKISGNQADAKDIVQESFLQIYKSIASLQDNALFVQWFNRIIASKASDLFRKNKTTSLPDDHVVFLLQEEKDITFIPEAHMHFSSDHELLNYFIQHLDERYRTVIVLRYFSQMSVAEIAEALQIPDGTVKTRLKRAREMLKQVVAHYQRAEGISLDFRSADMAVVLSAFFMSECAAMVIPIPASFSLGFLYRMKHLSYQGVIGFSVCAFAAICVAAGLAYPHVQSLFEAQAPYSLPKNLYGPIMYQGEEVDRCEDAYYALTLFAHCEVEMSQKTMAELAAIKPLYDELKRCQGVYWQLLKLRGWDEKFEQFFI